MRPRILVAGNSHAASVKQALDKYPDSLGRHADVYFYVIPGGLGPNFRIEADRLVVGNSNPKFPPFAIPDEARTLALGRYDAIVVSALGYCDGGSLYRYCGLMQGQVHEFGPKPNEITNQPISKAAFREVLRGALENQAGFVFLKNLRATLPKMPVFVQPVPFLSRIVSTRPEWLPHVLYERPLEANRFIQATRIEVVERICQEVGVKLLPIPNSDWTKDYFTPEELVRSQDAIHTTPEYGKLIVDQIASALKDEGLWAGEVRTTKPTDATS